VLAGTWGEHVVVLRNEPAPGVELIELES